MYIIVHGTAALGASRLLRPAHACSNGAYHHVQHNLQHRLPRPRCSALFCSLPSRLLVCISAQLQSHPSPTPHGLCFDALALALRIRASYHCRGLRAPLHISGTGHSNRLLELRLVAFGFAFWSCLVWHTASSHTLLGQIDHSQPTVRLSLLPGRQNCAILGRLAPTRAPARSTSSLSLVPTACVSIFKLKAVRLCAT